MEEKGLKSGDLVWICVWDENAKKFYKVCGTIIQYVDADWVEVFAIARVFERRIKDVNKLEDKNKFIPWPFTFREKNYKKILEK